MRIDHPAEDDTPDVVRDSRAGDTPPAADAHEAPPNRAAYIAEHRATVEAAYREYKAARAWDEHDLIGWR